MSGQPTLYWEPKNYGRVACREHVSPHADTHDRLSMDDLKAMPDVDCEDCGVRDARIAA